METKNEALELARELEVAHLGHADEGPTAFSEAAAKLRSQFAEIEQLTNERDQARKTQQILLDELNAGYQEIKSEQRLSFRTERDQLKAKNEKLVSAVETVCEGFTLHPSARKILETGLYGEAPKENT